MQMKTTWNVYKTTTPADDSPPPPLSHILPGKNATPMTPEPLYWNMKEHLVSLFSEVGSVNTASGWVFFCYCVTKWSSAGLPVCMWAETEAGNVQRKGDRHKSGSLLIFEG